MSARAPPKCGEGCRDPEGARAAHYSAGAGEARIVRGVSEEEARQAARGDGEAR
jgi:hypothetical protein